MKTAKIILATVAIAMVITSIPNLTDASYTWYTDRDTVTVSSYNITLGWVNASLYYGDYVSSAGENMTGNWSMPTALNETASISMKIYNNGSTPIHCNLTVNGNQRVNNTTTINAGIEYSVGFTVSNYPQDYFNMTFNANSTDVFVNISIEWTNAEVTKSEFITGTHGIISSIKERYKTQPNIEFDKDDSWYTVEDKITVDISYYNNFTVELYDVILDIDYPSHAVNSPYDTISIDTLNNTMSEQSYLIGYQKNGPYVYSTGTAQQDIYGDYELGVRIKAYEDEKDCSWTFNPSSSDLAEYFPSLNTDTLSIEFDGSDVDFDVSSDGSITIEDIDVDEGLTTVEFTWTPSSDVTPTPTPTGISLTTILFIGIIVILCVILVAYLMKAKHQ
ncbi:MAG: hypothetical protein J7L32_04360 [Thermoplasmata archaeon]|nr:hypothetical protein [Thermoplasmata archaeon]